MVDFEYRCKICGVGLTPKNTVPHYVVEHPEMGHYAVPVAVDHITTRMKKPEKDEDEEETPKPKRRQKPEKKALKKAVDYVKGMGKKTLEDVVDYGKEDEAKDDEDLLLLE